MFEKIIASLLKGYVARYVDINADQLSVQLIYGRPIVVENLTFNRTALNYDIRTKLKLPIEIESLHVGKIQCSFVWSSLFFRSTSAAFIVRVENVRAVIKPIVLDDYEQENQDAFVKTNEDSREQKKKMRLELSEQQLEKEFEYLGQVKSSSWSIRRLILSFLEKIQVQVIDVDICYRSFTSENVPYKVGLAFDNIQISNELSNENMNRKVFQLHNLGFYVDTETPANLHHYVLVPSNSIKIYLTHNYFRSSLVSRRQPRYELECTFDDLNLKTDAEQIQVLSDVIRFIQYANTHRKFINDPSRPDEKVSKKTAKSWWRYITLVIIRTQNYLKTPIGTDQSHTTTNFWFRKDLLHERLKQMTRYKRFYRSYLDQKYSKRSNLSLLAERDLEEMKKIEMEFDLDCLLRIRRLIFRERANEHMHSRQQHQQQNQNEPASAWYMNYAYWVSTRVVDILRTGTATDSNAASAPSNPALIPLDENDQRLQEQVNTFIAQSLEDQDLSQNRRDALYLRLKFVLKSVQIDLIANEDPIFNFSLDNVSVLTELRPRHQSVLLYIRLDDLNIRDRVRTDAFPNIVCPKQRTQESSISSQRAPIFELSYETNPPSQQSRTKRLSFTLAVRSRGLCFICCPMSVERLRSFLLSAFVEPTTRPSVPSSPAPNSILQHWTHLKDRTTKQIKAAFEQIFSQTTTAMTMSSSHVKHLKQGQRRQRKQFEIYLDICAPQMIIPQSSNRALTVDFGYLTFFNDEYRQSIRPLENYDLHTAGASSPSTLTDFFQQRPYFFNEQTVSPVVSNADEDDNEEFATPGSSPLPLDDPLEPETNHYPINLIPREQSASPTTVQHEKNLHYSSFSLSLCDMQLGYLTYSNASAPNKLSAIIEKFGVCFLIQYRTVQAFDPSLPLIKVSGTLPKIIIHLDPSRIETIGDTIHQWGLFMDKFTSSTPVPPDDANNTVSTSEGLLNQIDARLSLDFRINEISLQLSDDLRALCELRVQNIHLTVLNHINANHLTFSVHTLMIVDAIQNHGKDYELLLTSNRALEINTQTGTLYESSEVTNNGDNDYLIQVEIHSCKNEQRQENIVNVDIRVNKLHFVFNPETLSILTNFVVNVIHRFRSIGGENLKESNQIKVPVEKHHLTTFQINSQFQELSILFVNVLTIKTLGKRVLGTRLEKIAAARIRAASLNITLEPPIFIEAEICVLQIFNLLPDSSSLTLNEQSSAIIDLGTDEKRMIEREFDQDEALPSKAFYLSYIKRKEQDHDLENLSIEMASVCYTHSPKIISKIETICKYMAQRSHSNTAVQMEKVKQNVLKQGTMLLNQLVLPNESVLQTAEIPRQFKLNIVLATPILIFRPQGPNASSNDRLVFHLGHIHIENPETHPSAYEIKVNHINLFSIDLKHEFRHNQGVNLIRMYKNPHLPLPILDDISIHLHLHMTDTSTSIDSKLVSSVQMFLGKHQITLLQHVISSLTVDDADQIDAPLPNTPDEDPLLLFDGEDLQLDTSDSSSNKTFKTFAMDFQLPELILVFQADFDLKPTKVCEAIFGQFQMSFKQAHPFRKTLSLKLNSLQIIDHLIEANRCLFSTRCRRSASSHFFAADHFLSSSLPTENHVNRHRSGHFSPSSVPAYNVNHGGSTWSLTTAMSSSMQSTPVATPAFIDINITLIDKKHEDYRGLNIIADAQFGEVNIEFVITTWVMLFDIIGLIGGRPSALPTGTAENKEFGPTSDTDFMQISIHIDAVSCLLTHDNAAPIRISLQRFDCQIQNILVIEKALRSLTVNGTLGSVSILDLSQYGHLYEERFCTSGTNALSFIYTKEVDLIPISSSNFPSRLRLYLRMTSVQYIHTQRFLMSLIHFFDRFQHDQDCYNLMRSAAAGQVISCTAGRSTGIELDIEAGSPILILPEYALNKPVIALHLGHIIIKNRFLFDHEPGTMSALMNKERQSKCLLDVITVQFQDTQLYSAMYCKLDPNIKTTVQFSTFGFHPVHPDRSSMLREQAHLKIQIERNLDSSLDHSSPTFSVKADLSSVDILLDTSQYALVRGILAYNIGEQLEQPTRSAMIVDDPKCLSTVITGDVYLDMIFIIQMVNVGFEIFIPNELYRYSLGYCAFSKSSFSFEKYSNNDQVLDLTCSSIKLTDTRQGNSNQFRDILTSSSSGASSSSQMQLEIHLKTNKIEEKYTVVLNHTRILFIIDWLLKLNDFLSSFQQTPMTNNAITPASPAPAKKLFEIRINVNQSELVLVQTTNNPRSNALVLSGVMTLTYRESQPERPLDCTLFNVTLFSCQMDQLQSTAVSIIEPININFNIHQTKDKLQKMFELHLPKLFIRLSYNDVKLMLYMFRSIRKQIDVAQLREAIPKYTSILPPKPSVAQNEILMEFCPTDSSLVDFPVRPAAASTLSVLQTQQSIEEINEKPATTFWNLHAIKFKCDQISLCLIDDCFDANIPLLNIILAKMTLSLIEYETSRFQHAEFHLNIDYYNRLLSGYEPFIESWPLTMTLKTSDSLTSLAISSNHVLNINYTKTMHQLYDLVKNNWFEDYYNTTDAMLENMSFRQPKPFEPYCFKNLIGKSLKFRTWLSSQQRYDHFEHVVDYRETKSFTFPTESSTTRLHALRENASTSSYSDRRLLITIDGWQPLDPISIDHVGTFFRLAKPTNVQVGRPVLVFIDVAMVDGSMRSITIRSTIEVRNQLLTSIDVRLKCGSGDLHDLRLEPNEILSLPLQCCPTLNQLQVRPSDFGLNYCSEPINWRDINHANRLKPQQLDDSFSGEQSPTQDAYPLNNHRDGSAISRQSFFRTCTMNGNEALYFVCIQSKRMRLYSSKELTLSSCQLSILSPFVVNNLLPCDLFFQIYPSPQKIRLNAYKAHREHSLNIDQAIDIVFSTDLYHMEKPLRVPSINDLHLMSCFHRRVPFYDSINRVLLLDVTIVCSIRHRLKITVSVPYILLNKSGIPLIFKQEGAASEAAGQTHEHELARNREPLLFSFSDPEGSHACLMKVGQGLHKNDDGRPVWSQRFSLERGSNYRQLYVRSPHGSPDWIYYIGIDVRQGKGRLRRTNFIFLSTRFMISNQCSYDLLMAQRHIVRAMIQTGDDHMEGDKSCLHVLKHSNVAYHWPRSDLDQLLCVKVINNRQYRQMHWSGGFLIDRVNAFHINLRHDNNQCLILRVQVIERGGTFFVVFMDSNQMPAPLRIKNLSDVPIQFYQTDTREDFTYLRTFIQPHQSIDYAWDEITLKQSITCSVMGGTKETYDLQKFGPGENLCYENHIYLALEHTFDEQHSNRYSSVYSNLKPRPIRDRHMLPLVLQQHLVIDYIQGKLVLAQREENKRSQLWRMTSSGVLVHTGSSSPRDWSNKNDTSDDIRQASVLDVEEMTANHPYHSGASGRFNRLTVRRYDPKRFVTQTWTFHDDGYLCMSKTQMCVQVFGELRENAELVLGSRRSDQDGKPLPPLPTMLIRPRRRLKGSGLLAVRTYADGPTRVLEISDVKASVPNDNLRLEANKSALVRSSPTTTDSSAISVVHRLELRLEAGIGVSVISSMGHESEELVYMLLNDIHLKYSDANNDQSIDATIGAIIVSNQLLTTTVPCLLFTTYDEDLALRAAVHVKASIQKPTMNYKQLHIFRYFCAEFNQIIIQLDEMLLWKLIDFLDINSSSSSSSSSSPTNRKASTTDIQTYDFDEGEYDTQRLLSLLTSTQATRFYFNDFSISSIDLNLSVHCGNIRSLPPHLLNTKRRAPFPLIRFENAQIHLKSYENIHIFNTYDFFLLALTKHYVDELKRQAFKILGSVDFLGNPLGLFNDVTDGVASLMDHGSVTGLVRNVAHGVADSASKFTGTLSYGIGKLTLDQEHDDMREAIANNYRGSTIGHVIGGTIGLAAGVIGGLTSMITQPYKGVVEDGVTGLASGFVKGLFGTVSKPVVGILDFANGLALAVKEGARSSNSILRSRIRQTRCSTNIFGLLQPFSEEDADGQSLLYQMNQGNLSERYITRLILSRTPLDAAPRRKLNTMTEDEYAFDRRSGRVLAMITSQRVIIYRVDMDQTESDYEVIVDYDFSSISDVRIIEGPNRRPYVQFFLHSQSRRMVRMISKNDHNSYLTIFRCDFHEDASRLIRDIKRAREIFDEEKMTYIPPEDDNVNDDDDDIPAETQTDESAQVI